ncbi:MAG TPA: hypothetical protein VGF55_23445 [Gemmataceae bacterium]|jgi:hypothetical protein
MNPTLAPAPRRFAPQLVFLAAVAVPLVYLPTLGTRFDFIDDGNLVYPAPPMPAADRLHLVWDKVVANYEHLGPFRPVLWAHWDLAAELFRADPWWWRLARLVWSGVAVAALLALLRELRVRPAAALFVAALAFWNPYRNEIWTSLTLSEGVAMPYALAALWCAARANRSDRAWPWDLASAVGVVLALGCKNTFAALVPAQVYLRLYADGAGWRDGLRRHGRSAAALCLTLPLPVAHYVYFRLHWHAGQYPPSGPTLAQLGRLLRSLAGAESVEFVGVGLVLALAALAVARRSGVRPAAPFTTLLPAGALLLAAGLAVYLPIPAVSGRYTMPGVWGLDLMLAGLLSSVAAVPAAAWRRAAWVGLAGGLAVVAAASVGRQEKFAARAAVLWQALEYVEQTAVPAEHVAWYSGPALNVEEGIHFRWHLLARGHDVPVDLYDEGGRPEARRELPPTAGPAGLAVTGTPDPPPGGSWELRRSFRRPYWGGRKEYDCYLWAAN